MVEGKDINMELDTGASVSVISEKLYKQFWPGRSFDNSLIRLQTSICCVRQYGSNSVL